MREILFRGKRFSTGEWVYGGLMQRQHPNFDGECYCICADGKDYFVEQNSIGQFTGITDRNGRKMYEGDIVRFGKFTYEVKYSSCRMGFYFSRLPKGGCIPGFTMMDWETLEIIGNIHDNPELLEAK